MVILILQIHESHCTYMTLDWYLLPVHYTSHKSTFLLDFYLWHAKLFFSHLCLSTVLFWQPSSLWCMHSILRLFWLFQKVLHTFHCLMFIVLMIFWFWSIYAYWYLTFCISLIVHFEHVVAFWWQKSLCNFKPYWVFFGGLWMRPWLNLVKKISNKKTAHLNYFLCQIYDFIFCELFIFICSFAHYSS